jgi:hypothetical protein
VPGCKKSGFAKQAEPIESSMWLSFKKRSMYYMCLRSARRKQRSPISSSASADMLIFSSGEGRKVYEAIDRD